MQRASILLAEDNPADVFMVREALAKWEILADVHVARDGEMALQWIETADSDESIQRLDLALVDLNLPLRDGQEVLERVRRSARCGDIPVIIISSSPSRRDMDALLKGGANHFFTKPTIYEEYLLLGGVVKTLLKLHYDGR